LNELVKLGANNTPIFLGAGSKCKPLLQMERGYNSNRSAPGNVFFWDRSPPHLPLKIGVIFRGGYIFSCEN